MTLSGIEMSISGSRARIELNRPDQLNPLGYETLRALVDAARAIDREPDVKVVVVSGRGRAFSAGADLAAFAGLAGTDVTRAREFADAGRQMAEAIEAMNAVTIARLHGHVVGGGVVLAAACDLRVAAGDTRFSIPELDLGIPLAWGGIPRLVRELGPALTKELVMTCRPFGAAEAREARFVNRVVPPAELDAAVEELARTLEGKSALTLSATKRHANAAADEMVGTARAWSDADSLLTAASDPASRAVAAVYLQRRAQRKGSA